MLRGAVLVHMSRLEYYCSARPCSTLESKSSCVKSSAVRSSAVTHHITPHQLQAPTYLPTAATYVFPPSQASPPARPAISAAGAKDKQAGRQQHQHHTIHPLSAVIIGSQHATQHNTRKPQSRRTCSDSRTPSLTDPTRHIRHSRLLLGVRQRAKSRGMRAGSG
jgi:hypothetical protein